jgi:hypothetical protein
MTTAHTASTTHPRVPAATAPPWSLLGHIRQNPAWRRADQSICDCPRTMPDRRGAWLRPHRRQTERTSSRRRCRSSIDCAGCLSKSAVIRTSAWRPKRFEIVQRLRSGVPHQRNMRAGPAIEVSTIAAWRRTCPAAVGSCTRASRLETRADVWTSSRIPRAASASRSSASTPKTPVRGRPSVACLPCAFQQSVTQPTAR